ncbi:Transcription factor iws1 [Dispira parvispora]|uniref:Transcription factor iws1 n=1 Tax=Dispira parvispora TaxID=1520584 RepID=A0A9W8ASV6_9FUNG|nr:Transcription factor iws1 [Dispira parvispora]
MSPTPESERTQKPEEYDDLFGGGSDDEHLQDLGALSDDEIHDEEPPVEEEHEPLPSFRKRPRDEHIAAGVSAAQGEPQGDDDIGYREKVRVVSRHERQISPESDMDGGHPEEMAADPKQAVVDQVRKDFDRVLKSGSGRGRRKNDDIDLESQTDEMIARLRTRMREVAELDRMEHNEKRPAIGKIKMLPLVTSKLRRVGLHDQMLEGGILDAMRMWLEPLDDGSLPALDIQVEFFDILQTMPIRTDHLRESGMGRIVTFFTKCPRVSQKIQRIAEELVGKWSRPIIRRSADYRDRRLQTSRDHYGPAMTTPQRSNTSDLLDDIDPALMSGNRMHLPRYTTPSYEIMPTASPLVSRMAKSSRQQPEQLRRIKANLGRKKG